MDRLIEKNQEALNRLCARHGVQRLELFGSAASDRFDSERSDVDFLVTFRDPPPQGWFDAYFGSLHALEDLFYRPVDLVMESAVTNPYFLENIARTRTLLFAA